jgi:acyl-CoA synthetase (NDP forming)
VVPTQLARSPSEAARLAKRLRLPAALKIVSADIVHKSDVGGVRLHLTNFSQVNKAYGDIIAVVRSRLLKALHGCSSLAPVQSALSRQPRRS